MSDKGNGNNGNNVNLALQEEVGEQLFRLAEIIHAPEGVESGVSQKDRLEAAKTMAELLKVVTSISPDPVPRVLRHNWILDVLEDLANFAENQELTDLEAVLNRARSEAAEILWRV